MASKMYKRASYALFSVCMMAQTSAYSSGGDGWQVRQQSKHCCSDDSSSDSSSSSDHSCGAFNKRQSHSKRQKRKQRKCADDSSSSNWSECELKEKVRRQNGNRLEKLRSRIEKEEEEAQKKDKCTPEMDVQKLLSEVEKEIKDKRTPEAFQNVVLYKLKNLPHTEIRQKILIDLIQALSDNEEHPVEKNAPLLLSLYLEFDPIPEDMVTDYIRLATAYMPKEREKAIAISIKLDHFNNNEKFSEDLKVLRRSILNKGGFGEVPGLSELAGAKPEKVSGILLHLWSDDLLEKKQEIEKLKNENEALKNKVIMLEGLDSNKSNWYIQ